MKLELWYLNTPEVAALCEAEGVLTGRGALLTLLRMLRLCHHATGQRRQLEGVAAESGCTAEWLWHVVTDFGLFDVGDDGTFSCPYLTATLGMSRKRQRPRGRTRYNARYNEDNKDNKDNEDKENKKNNTCRADSHASGRSYLGYDRWVDGSRYGYRGEPVPPDAPEQVSQDTRWSWMQQRWVARTQWHEGRERKEYERKTGQRWQTNKTNGRS